MKPETKVMKNAIAALGIPRRDITTRTDLGSTVATVHEPAHRALVAEKASQLVGPHRGVLVWRYACGCISRVWVTTDPRHADRVETNAAPGLCGHRCMTLATPSREGTPDGR